MCTVMRIHTAVYAVSKHDRARQEYLLVGRTDLVTVYWAMDKIGYARVFLGHNRV